MVLSPEREAELIEQNMPKIYRAIDNFTSKCNQKQVIQIPYEDFVQEVVMMFLKYIRRCETEDQLNTFPWYDAKQVMSLYVLQNQPLSVPRRTSGFRETIHSIPKTVSYEVLAGNSVEVDGMSKHWVQDKETEIDFDAFMSAQNENIQRIASMRLYGMTYRKIAGQCGVSKSFVDKKIRKLREDYDEFDKEDTYDE